MSATRPDMGLCPKRKLSSADIQPEKTATLLNPHDLIYVKGWTRGVCAVLVMLAGYEEPGFLEARLSIIL